MKSYRHKTKKFYKSIYWIFLFVLAAFALQLILPGEPKFKYEYLKGSPWKHENLVAPFDFAIFKSNNQLEQEKKVVESSIVPYFVIDTMVSNQFAGKFRDELREVLDTSLVSTSIVMNNLLSKLREIYASGILERSPESYLNLEGKKEVSKITGNISEKVPIESLFSEKTAYNELSEYVLATIAGNPILYNKLSPIETSTFIKSNLSFDGTTTQKEIDEALAAISPTFGMVQAGERIILNGEIVDNNKFLTLESLKNSYAKKRGDGINSKLILTGKLMLIIIFLSLIFVFLLFYRYDILEHFRRLAFLLSLIITMVFLSVFANSYEGLHIYIVPLAILPIVVRTFFDSRTAIFCLVITTLIIGLYAPNNYEYVLLQITAGVLVVFSLAKMHRRSHLIMASIWVMLAYSLVYIAINLIQGGNILDVDFRMLRWFAINSVFIFAVYPLIYVFEKLFGFISDVTLIELSDTNQPLLRKLADEAPGTFQHSMQIANLAEEVILKIGGNPFLVRAGALYHDIGKIAKADHFTENQFGIQNPHNQLPYTESAKIIVDHVNNGIKLARRNNLPEKLIEFIATHHGTTKAKYFYLKQQEDFPNKQVDKDAFSYPGPLPTSKEAAVVMLVDGIEAASRSMKDKTEENLRELVNNMVNQKVNEHQLDNSKLTFRDINNIKNILVNKLINVYHVRIAYPKEKGESV